ncbi:LysR family pca operon transcriptional activator [Paraburkholderia sp. BL27I4N3]|uniref:LysR substrate-binding domain-containing protein n=1 Tax=Paraburkholderia sp. BL27I4N3 TaxID=1938805 RepID=UPI000E277617|nr:LysR substrate-binding domain-containing protein [Paraburkholderia sp. BL27I4N3]REE17732.1 LysR family pca operon transcriptional activator [Paraburkholderia sp. BL27I4N3]
MGDNQPPAKGQGSHDAFDDLTRLKLRHLTCLLEISRTGSVRKTAELLFVTDSAVSKTLKELEDELNIKLFERSKSGMSPTEAGKRFITYAANAVEMLKSGVNSARGNLSGGSVKLRVGSMPIPSAVLLPLVINELVAQKADVSVEVVAGSKETLLDRLRKGAVDVVLGRLPPVEDMTGLSFEQLFLDQYIFVTRQGHPLADKDVVSLSDLSRFTLVMPPRETVTYKEIDRLFVSRGEVINSKRVETIYLTLSRNLLDSTDAVWAASYRLLADDITSGALHRLPIDTTMLESPIGIISRPGDDLTASQRVLLSIIRKHAAALRTR